MANTYTQIYIHTAFAVEGRQSLIAKEHKIEIYKYITGVIHSQKQKVMAINGMPDHVHLLIGVSPDIALSDLVRDVKAASSRLINDKRWVRGHFNWQRGFGAFSCSHSQVPTVAKYIENQEHHHAKRSFRDEYVALLKKFDVEYDPAYLFTFIDDVG
ncbi:MAG TPA: IS200/IS605 family transposase [Blastocatellia bacterium]|nr:IS200/IS605 family transposase [Blastocatellia bacterium]